MTQRENFVDSNTNGGRRLVIPDIHGCFRTLFALMEKMAITHDDQVFFLGDYIDRGPNSSAVLDFIIDLIDTNHKIYTLRGNHEQMLLDIARFDKQSLKSHARSFNILDLIEDGAIKQKYLEFLNSLSYYFELEDFFLVHAGFNFDMELPFEDKEAMLWIRNFDPDATLQQQKPIIHGHVPTPLREIMNSIGDKKLKVPLDNGCVYAGSREDQGHLLCLNLDTFDLTVQQSIEE